MGLFGDIVGGITGLLGMEEAETRMRKALRELQREKPPVFDYRQLLPEALLEIARFTPTTYAAEILGAPAAPTPDEEARRKALEVLAALETLGQGGLTPEQIELANIERAISAEQQGLLQRGLEALAERGITGGRSAAGLRAAAQQAAAERARGLGSDLMQQVLLRNLQALSTRGQLASQIAGQDLARALAHAEAINRFNEWASQLKTRAALETARSQEAARTAQETLRQKLAEENAKLRMGYQEANLERLNRLRQQDWANRFARAQALANQQASIGSFLGEKYTPFMVDLAKNLGTNVEQIVGLLGLGAGTSGKKASSGTIRFSDWSGGGEII